MSKTPKGMARSGWVCWWINDAGTLMYILPSTCDYTRSGSIALFNEKLPFTTYRKAKRNGRAKCLPVNSHLPPKGDRP